MKDSLNTLKELASSVRNATKEGENSAERIGRLFEGILEYIKTPESIENYFELKQDGNGLDYIYTKYNIASAGALSMYASDKINIPSIYDGLPIDNDTIYWHEVDGSKVLKAKGGGGEAGSVQWDNISGKPSWIEDTKPSYSWSDITGEKPFYTKEEIASKYVTIDTEQEITALKHFTAGLSVGESKKNIYEENGVVYIDADVAVTGAMTFYASAGRTVSTIMDAVAVDGITIKKENNVLKAVSGAGSSFDENAMWSALSGSSDNQINKSHLTMALDGYATRNWVIENYATKSELSAVSNKLNDFLEGSDTDNIINKWKELEAFLSGMAETDNLAEILKTKADRSYVDSTFVTLATKQTITGEKTFSSVLNTTAIKASGAITTPSLAASDWVTIAGIKLRKLEDGALMLEGNLALTGALTMYASNGQSFDTIYDGLPIDNDTIYWQEVDGSRVLKAKEGSGSSFDKSAMWTALAGSTTEQINKTHLTTALNGYATESWVTGKGYITSSALNGYATESWVSGKNYAVKATTLAGYGITDGVNDVSVTGTGNAVTAASISGHTLTLTKGSTFSLSGHKHAWSDITSGKPTTLSGYGITDAYTKTDADSRYVNVSGDTMTGNLSVKFSGRTDQINLFHSTTTNRGGLSLTDTDNTVHAFHLTTTNLLWKGRTVWDSGNDGSGSGLDADLLDGTHKSGLLTALTSSSGTNISITVGGTTKSITDLYAYASTKLETARTLWGRSFDGTGNVSGNLDNVGNITGTGHISIIGKSDVALKCNNNDALSVTLRANSFKPFDSANNNIDLGASTAKWRDLYVGRNANIDGVTKTGDFYIGGIRLHKTADGVITLEGNLAVTGGVTTYAIDPVSASTIMDGVVVDGTTIKKENGKLVAVGGGEAGSVAWGNISGKPSVFATNIANITDLHSSWDSVLAAQKPAWLTAVSIATISDLNSGWDALLKAVPSAYVTRWPTISEVTNKQNLVIKLNGGTTEGTNQFTYNATAAKSLNITPAGIGAYTKSESDSKYPTKTGSGASGTWGINVTGNASNADKLDGTHKRSGNTYWGVIPYVESDGTFEVGKYVDFHNSSTGTIDYSTRLQCDGDHNNTLILPTRDGNLALLSDNVASASKLQTERKIWGVGFNGTNDVVGNITLGDYDIIGHGGARIIQNMSTGDLCLNPARNVGIGKTAATYKLDVEGSIFSSNGFVTTNNTILSKIGYTHTEVLSWYWDSTYGDHVKICIPGTNDQSKYIIISASKGLVVNGNTIINNNDIIGYGNARIIQNLNGHLGINPLNNVGIGTTDPRAKLHVNGDILSAGGGTFYSSDKRAKTITGLVSLSLKQVCEAPTIRFRWNGWYLKDDGRNHIGGIAQYINDILPECVIGQKDNFLSMDYATVAYTFAVHTARHLLTYETRTDKKIKKLENRVKYLEKQLKKLGYEEVRTLDDQSV